MTTTAAATGRSARAKLASGFDRIVISSDCVRFVSRKSILDMDQENGAVLKYRDTAPRAKCSARVVQVGERVGPVTQISVLIGFANDI